MGLPRAVIVGLLCAMTLLPNGCGVGPPPLSIALTSREVTERALVVKCGDVVTGVLEIDDATRMRWATMDLGVTSARGIVSLRGVEGLVPVHISVRVDVQQLLSMQGKECYAAVSGVVAPSAQTGGPDRGSCSGAPRWAWPSGRFAGSCAAARRVVRRQPRRRASVVRRRSR
jgi:hypothetical protein